MEASAAQPYDTIGYFEPIIKIHVMDKASMPILLLGHTLLQLILAIQSRITVKKGLLLHALATWFLLCGGQRRDDAADPFQSLEGFENTVVGIIRGDECPEDPCLSGYHRPGYSQPGGYFESRDSFSLGPSSLLLFSSLR